MLDFIKCVSCLFGMFAWFAIAFTLVLFGAIDYHTSPLSGGIQCGIGVIMFLLFMFYLGAD